MKNIILLFLGVLTTFISFSFKPSDKMKNIPNKKKVLIIGIDPKLIDFSSPEYAAFPGLTAEKVETGVKAQRNNLTELGYESELCWTDFGQTALTVIEEKLNGNKFDGVLIGAGIRVPPINFLLFEKIINKVHEKAPKAKIIFNTKPSDTVEGIQRWL